MGVISKQKCTICGKDAMKSSLATIADGYMCQECKRKISKHYDSYWTKTAAEIQTHIQYREENLKNLKSFIPTKVFLEPVYENSAYRGPTVYVDENSKKIVFSYTGNFASNNPDIFDYSDLLSFTYAQTLTNYINVTIKARYKPCNTIVSFTYTIVNGSVSVIPIPRSGNARNEPSNQYKKILEADAFFKKIIDSNVNHDYKANIQCPHCGAVSTGSGRTIDCEFCGQTFENPFYGANTGLNDKTKASEENSSNKTQEPAPPKIQVPQININIPKAAPGEPKTNILCLTGFIVSLVSILCCGGTSIIGLALSIVGLIQVKKSGEPGDKLAIAGIIISGCFVLIFIFTYARGFFSQYLQ